MQVHGVKSGIVGASNGGCDAFDVNRSLAEGIINLNDEFLDSSPAALALGIIALQKPGVKQKTDFGDYAEVFSNLEI